MLEILLIGGLVYLLYSSGQFSALGFPSAQAPPMTPSELQASQTYVTQQALQGVPYAAPNAPVSGPNTMQSVAFAGQTAASAAPGIAAGIAAGGILGAATLGIGAAVTIFTTLWGQHELRIRQAKDENSAMNVGVQGFDQDIQYINSQYNTGMIDQQTAIRALQQALAQFWQLVAPHIQPGRNGCNAGQNCDTMLAVGRTGKQNCVGDIGAACCVGCNDLYMSLYAQATDPWVPKGPGAVTVLQSGGGTSYVKTVYGSSYGGQTRNGYTLQWRAA